MANIPHWQNPDGTLKCGVAYWVYENYLQWAEGRHNAHVHAYYQVMADAAFQEYRYIRSLSASAVYESSVNPNNENVDPVAYVLGLRREMPEVKAYERRHGVRVNG